ncbi:hypothetical protein [Mycobacterium kiyosense]
MDESVGSPEYGGIVGGTLTDDAAPLCGESGFLSRLTTMPITPSTSTTQAPITTGSTQRRSC